MRGKNAVITPLSENWKEAWPKFNTDFRKTNKDGVLLYPSGRIYTFSGPRNNWNFYYEGLEAIGKFFQTQKTNVAPCYTETECGIWSQAD